MFSWLLRWCTFCRRWEIESGTPLGWQEARRARGLGKNDEAQVAELYRGDRYT